MCICLLMDFCGFHSVIGSDLAVVSFGVGVVLQYKLFGVRFIFPSCFAFNIDVLCTLKQSLCKF